MNRIFLSILILILHYQGLTMSVAATNQTSTVSWRETYILGAGDVLNIGLYSRPELTREQISIQADGTINYLQIIGLKAEGLTINQLRQALNQALKEYYRYPSVMITPFELKSKKYFMLGSVVDKGVFTMNKPTTLLQAVARARGIETGLFEGNTVEMADLPRSFLMRGGKRVNVDFEKLFQEGDLSQNIELEPNDYIYFASANVNEIYVLGQVGQPGALGFTPRATVLTAITARGGFTPKAYRDKVLVIRGSLSKPQSFVVDVNDILKGKIKDFRLEPKDIIYVSQRPWLFAEELMDLAISSFIDGAVTSWTGVNIHFRTQPVLPQIK